MLWVDVVRLLLFVALILIVMVGGDALVYLWPAGVPSTYWALLDPPVHALLALAVALPLFTRPELGPHLMRWVLIAVFAAVMIDVDHLIAAGSLSLEDALQLESRPIAHSLLFILIAAVATLILTRQVFVTYLILIVLLSHILRDASHGGAPLFWPLGGSVVLSIPVYYGTQIALGLAAVWLSGGPARSLRPDTLVQAVGRLWVSLPN